MFLFLVNLIIFIWSYFPRDDRIARRWRKGYFFLSCLCGKGKIQDKQGCIKAGPRLCFGSREGLSGTYCVALGLVVVVAEVCINTFQEKTQCVARIGWCVNNCLPWFGIIRRCAKGCSYFSNPLLDAIGFDCALYVIESRHLGLTFVHSADNCRR
jgi:hypothetical protein